MTVIDYVSGAWFLLKEGNDYFLDVNCENSGFAYNVCIKLDDAERSLYVDERRAFIVKLADEVSGTIGLSDPRNINDKALSDKISQAIKKGTRHQNCSICSSLKDYERGFQKSGEGSFLPHEAGNLSVAKDLGSGGLVLKTDPPLEVSFSRELQLKCCPLCRTYYLYWTDYEFIYGGTEDEQNLKRLSDEQAQACLGETDLPYDSGPDPQSATKAAAPPPVKAALPPEYIVRTVDKKQLAEIGKELAEEFEKKAEGIFFKDDNHQYALDDAQNIRSIIEMMLEPSISDKVEEERGASISGYPEAYPRSASLEERYEWFRNHCENLEGCSLCGTLTDELQVNSGREDHFPEAFLRLTWMGNYNHRVSTFLRCPECFRYFNWIVCPDMYGFGSVGEEHLTRLTGRASRLLDKILSLDPNYYPDRPDVDNPASDDLNGIEPKDVEENFDAVPFNVLLQALKYRIAAAPQILGPFVPKLISFLAKHPDYSDPLGLREMLKNYASSKPERSEEIVEAFLSLKEEEYSTFTDILRHCLTIDGKKN